jgi:hypothetical protein
MKRWLSAFVVFVSMPLLACARLAIALPSTHTG